jgi:hypothetical protein
MATLTNTSRRLFPLLIAASALLPTSAAHAQTPPVVTYEDSRPLGEVITSLSAQAPEDVNQRPTCQRLVVPCTSPRTVPDGGVALTLSVFPHALLGIVGEGSIYANEWSTYGQSCSHACLIAESNKVRALLGGLRLRTPVLRAYRSSGGVRLFTQVLAGPEWSDATQAHHVLQPGIGLDRYIWNRTAILHLEYDHRFAPHDIRNLSTNRFLIGLGAPLGSI